MTEPFSDSHHWFFSCSSLPPAITLICKSTVRPGSLGGPGQPDTGEFYCPAAELFMNSGLTKTELFGQQSDHIDPSLMNDGKLPQKTH